MPQQENQTTINNSSQPRLTKCKPPFLLLSPDERPGDHHGRGAGVRDPADHDREAALRPGGEDDRSEGGVVLRSPVHRLEGGPNLDQALQEGQ